MKKSIHKTLFYSIAIILSVSCICIISVLGIASSGSTLSTPIPIQIFDTSLPIPTIIALTYSAARTQTATYNPMPLSTAILTPTQENIATSIGTSTFTPTVTMASASTVNSETMNAQATFYNSTPFYNSTSIFTPFIYPTSGGVIVNPPSGGVCSCSGPDLDCKVEDFATHAIAQACFEHCKSLGYSDVHGLDGNDKDGLACENLP